MENDLKTKIALLEQNIIQEKAFLSRLDVSIEKLTDITFSIKEILSIHEHQLKQQETVNIEIYNLIRELKAENAKDHEITKNLVNELSRRIHRLERWRYAVASGATVVGFTASSFLHLFKIV